MIKLTIKQAAEAVGRSQQTILNWEAEGLITLKRDDRGWRIFTPEDLDTLERIKEQKRDIMISGRGNVQEEAEDER